MYQKTVSPNPLDFLHNLHVFLRVRQPLRMMFVVAVATVAMLVSGCDSSVAPSETLEATGKIETLEATGKMGSVPGPPQLLVTGLEGASGSAIGPDGALFVTEGAVGRISRVDPKTGDVTTFASGLPPSIVGIGGVIDVAFLDETAYALVTLVGPQFGSSDIVGIYRIDGPNSHTVVADIGAFSLANPPTTPFFVDMGVQYSIQTYRGGFLVTDGHHNRVLHVTLDGEITEFKTFDNIVPTGLARSGNTVYMAEAGPVPHLPEDGMVVSFGQKSATVTKVASGARLLVDVEFGRGRTLFALSQGVWDGVAPGSPAEPNTGSLVRVGADGTLRAVTTGLDRPTSLEFIGNTAYIVTLGGEVWTIDNVAAPPFGAFH
ncbi:MAG: ScyD/ScyE family protein [Rhodothermales bacterium]